MVSTTECENFCMSLCVVMGNNSIAGNGDDDSVEIGQLSKQIYVASIRQASKKIPTISFRLKVNV